MEQYVMNEEALMERYLPLARELAGHIEQGNNGEAERVMDELMRVREQSIFHEIGRLTRDLHDTLRTFREDSRIAAMAQQDIPDARERLNHVINMTEDAAQRTLRAIEETTPMSEEISRQAAAILKEWERFTRREMSVDEFRAMSQDLIGFLGEVQRKSGHIHTRLTDVLVAQQFQDITGQILKRVITLVQNIEDSLVALVRVSGQRLLAHGPKEGLEGPQLAPHTRPDVVANQDQVDDLLSSLGF